MVCVKVPMTKTEWEVFISQSPIKPEQMRPVRPSLWGPDESFWDPNKAANLRIGETPRPGARFLGTAFDDTNPNAVVVYIIDHGT
ncbi:hypothetical protein ACFL5O_07835 [Myxococcota bacterium]